MKLNEQELKSNLSDAIQKVRQLTEQYFQSFNTIPLLSKEEVLEIPQISLIKAKIYANRYLAVESEWPQKARVLEVGTQTGDFANFIYENKNPCDLQAIDISYDLFKKYLPCDSLLKKHVGKSNEIMRTMPESYFDVVYIDASHDFQDVISDIDQARRITKNNGLIVCNDYTWYSPAEFSEYGVIRAVNNTLNKDSIKVKYLALHTHGFFDIAFINKKNKL